MVDGAAIGAQLSERDRCLVYLVSGPSLMPLAARP